MAVGFVYLVGAGPGDPGCLTLRGRECLARADVVIYDYLANADLLAHAPPGAIRVFGGKHGAGPHPLDQQAINELLVEHAMQGRTVVRLKGGDPMVFARGAEEAETLFAAGIPFEIVPGVTAAFAVPAFAGIPLTHRDWVSGVTVLTGHDAEGRAGPRFDWKKVATAGNTLVLLMGVTRMRQNLDRLMAAGLAPQTPAAAIRWGSRPWQEVLEGTVGDLADQVEAGRVRPPVTVVVGEVVRLRSKLAWFERRPLSGRRVLVTRAEAQAEGFSTLLRESGADVLECPAIEVRQRPEGLRELGGAIAALESYEWVLFTSVNGVEIFFERLRAEGRDLRALGACQIGVIGTETGRAVRRLHLEPDVIPDDFRAEGLLEALPEASVRGARILLPRALGARGILPQSLRERGARVDEINTYESVIPTSSETRLEEILTSGPVDCVTFTSSSTVTHFLELLDRLRPDRGREFLEAARIACIGPITEQTARAAGVRVDIVPDSYTISALSGAIARALRKEEL